MCPSRLPAPPTRAVRIASAGQRRAGISWESFLVAREDRCDPEWWREP